VIAQKITVTRIPACPATSAATRRFAAVRWGIDLSAASLDAPLRRRGRALIDRRRAGDARGADVLGWLTLAAICAGTRPALITRLVKHPNIDDVLARTVAFTHDGLGLLALPDEPAHDVEVAGLTVPDLGSRPGWALAQFAAQVVAESAAVIEGFPMAAAIALARVSARIDNAERRTR
jgi:hypothetical protein